MAIYTHPKYHLIRNSVRESACLGHYIMGIFRNYNQATLVVGVYGRPDNADRTCASIFKEMTQHIQQLKTLYSVHLVIIAGDFNAVRQITDTSSGKIAKPRTTAVLNDMIDTLGLQDLGQLTNKVEHTWKRRGAATQTSRIDYILTTADPTHVQCTTLKNWHTHLDHCMLAANIGLNKQQRTCSMKDFTLGSEEFILNLGEIIEQIREKNQLEVTQLACR